MRNQSRQSRRGAAKRWTFWRAIGAALVLTGGASAALAQGCRGTDQRAQIAPAFHAEVATKLARAPFAEGVFWTATRGQRRVHVIGTFHLNDPRFDIWLPAFLPLLERADILLVESTLEDQARLQKELTGNMGRAFITEGPTLIDRLGEAEWARVAEQASAAGIPPMLAAKMQPWFLSLALALPLCAKKDPTIKDGLDARLIAQATARDIPVAALEDAMAVVRLFSDVPLDQQVEDLRSYLAMSKVDEDQLASLSAAYFEQKVLEYALQEEMRFLTLPGPKSRSEREAEMADLMDKLLYQRNHAWMPVIEAAEGNEILVAVGALHMPGEQGILQLLQSAGYRLERRALPPLLEN